MVYKYAVFGTLVRNKVKIVYSVPHVRIEIKAAILSIKKERDFGPHFSYTVRMKLYEFNNDIQGRLQICFFVCLVFFVPLENSSLTWIRHHYRWRAMLGSYGHWAHLLWHGASVYNSQITRTYCRSFGSWVVTTCFTTYVCRSWDSNTQPSTCEAKALAHCAIAAATS